jgi:hypothetical protein
MDADQIIFIPDPVTPVCGGVKIENDTTYYIFPILG